LFPLNNFVTASLKKYSLKELRVFNNLKINFKEEQAVEKKHILEMFQNSFPSHLLTYQQLLMLLNSRMSIQIVLAGSNYIWKEKSV